MTVKTRHSASIRIEKEQQEIRMYGCTVEQMREVVEESLAFRFSGPAMYACSIMSDCQHMLAQYIDNNNANDFLVIEDVRQALNRAKFILSEYSMYRK